LLKDRQEIIMRYAFVSDIHGNSIGLDAVLHDIASHGGVDAIYLLGDYAAIGPDPLSVIRRISQIENAYFIRGNTDRYLYEGSHPPPSIEDATAAPQLLNTLLEVRVGFAWTQGAIAHFDGSGSDGAHWLGWMRNLPLEMRFTLPDGTRVLLVHAWPGHDDGVEGLYPDMSDSEVAALFCGHDADLIVVGHTHWQLERHVDGVHVVNPGSVGNPKGPITAKYALLQADTSGYEIALHEVAFDTQAVLNQLEQVQHPAPDYIRMFYSSGYQGH
jgi:putative phosphoesterase